MGDDDRIHVVAHNMGSRALIDALAGSLLGDMVGQALLQQVILAAPDIDADVFRQSAGAIGGQR